MLFASDCPFDKEKGRGYIRSTIEVMESLDISQADREKICHKNAETHVRAATALNDRAAARAETICCGCALE